VSDIRFARSGDIDVAYRAVGDGPVDLVYAQGAATHLELNWELPQFRRYCERLAEFTHLPWFDPDATLAEIREFLTGRREAATPDRVLATVLSTDLVGSTERAAELGDRRWRDLFEQHHATVRRELARFDGLERDTAGDGFFATFDGPARAIRCACAIVDAVRPLQLEVRAGLHTGEVELVAEKVAGIAVNIGARVPGQAAPGEVLVSSTVRDLVAGSGLEFEDRGTASLKGIAGEWRLFKVLSD
jgi:class 3 adenylate cyclase